MKPLKINLLFVLISFSFVIYGQSYVYEGNITLNNQIEVNNFANTFSEITIIKGSLFIGSYIQKTSINDLTPLTKLLIIEGVLTISNTQVTTLQGLHKLLEVNTLIISKNDKLTTLQSLSQLELIKGALQIDDNPGIRNFEGLEQITHIGDTIFDYLQVYNNDGLESFSGLDSLKYVGGNFHIDYNDSITDLSSLKSLTSVGRYLTIRNNLTLSNLEGLENIDFVGDGLMVENNYQLSSLNYLGSFDTITRSFHLKGNPLLSDLTGLEHLTHIGDDMEISNNQVLYDLTGLNGLVYCGGGMEIVNNPNLRTLDGLYVLERINGELKIDQNDNLNSINALSALNSAGGVSIYQNPKLGLCKYNFVCNALNANSYVYINLNGSGCSDKDALINACGITATDAFVSELPYRIKINDWELNIYTEQLQNATLKLYTINGNMLTSRILSNVETVVDLSGLQKGMYLVQVKINDLVYAEKLMITK